MASLQDGRDNQHPSTPMAYGPLLPPALRDPSKAECIAANDASHVERTKVTEMKHQGHDPIIKDNRNRDLTPLSIPYDIFA